jgi:hypothetical protein
MRKALFLTAVLFFICGLGVTYQDFSKVQIKVSKVSGNVCHTAESRIPPPPPRIDGNVFHQVGVAAVSCIFRPSRGD